MKRLTRDVLFNSEHLSQGLAEKSVRGGMTTMTAQVIRFVLRITSTVILARLLTPEDYGLIAMVMVVVGFATMFKEAGLSMATVQKDRISHEQISTLFWINIIISTFLGVCVLAASPLVAKFYGRPELTAVTAALSVSFIISGLMIQHRALLRRHMKFGTLAVAQITSIIVSICVMIVLALFGWGYWALVCGSISSALAQTTLILFFCPWVPGRMKKGTGVRDMLKFGGHLTGFSFINYWGRNADNIIIGRMLGASAIGIYSKAYQLLMMPISMINSPITAVALPALSRLRDNPERFKQYYYNGVGIVAVCTIPLVALCYIVADLLILAVLGENWIEVVPVFRILAIPAFIGCTQIATGWAWIPLGNLKRMFYQGLVNSILVVIGFFIGVRWGVIGVATSYAITASIIRIPTLAICYYGTPLSLMRLAGTYLRPVLGSGVAVGAVAVIRMVTSNWFTGVIWQLAFLCAVFGVSYLAAIYMLGGQKTLVEALKIIRNKNTVPMTDDISSTSSPANKRE